MPSINENKAWAVKNRPTGVPTPENFELKSVSIPEIQDGEFLLRTHYISPDPYLRNVLNRFPENEIFVSLQTAEVIESKNPEFKKGDWVQANTKWQLYNKSNGKNRDENLRKIPPDLGPTGLGTLGMPGMTAYYILKDNLQIQKGQTIVISAAAGAVGSFAVQYSKLNGLRVIGVAGGNSKCNFVTNELGADSCIDYKIFDTKEKFQQELKKQAPNGVDLYLDNTGSHITDAIWDVLTHGAKVCVCGSISDYNSQTPRMIEDPLPKLIYRGIQVKGFIIFDYYSKPNGLDEFFKEVPKLVEEKKIKTRETIIEGFENIPKAFQGLFTGYNIGKMVVKVD